MSRQVGLDEQGNYRYCVELLFANYGINWKKEGPIIFCAGAYSTKILVVLYITFLSKKIVLIHKICVFDSGNNITTPIRHICKLNYKLDIKITSLKGTRLRYKIQKD